MKQRNRWTDPVTILFFTSIFAATQGLSMVVEAPATWNVGGMGILVGLMGAFGIIAAFALQADRRRDATRRPRAEP